MPSELPPVLPLLLLIRIPQPSCCSPRPSRELVWRMMPPRCLPLRPVLGWIRFLTLLPCDFVRLPSNRSIMGTPDVGLSSNGNLNCGLRLKNSKMISS